MSNAPIVAGNRLGGMNMGGIEIAGNFSSASVVGTVAVSGTAAGRGGKTLSSQLKRANSLPAGESRRRREPKVQQESLALNLTPGKNRYLAPPSRALWGLDASSSDEDSIEEPASGLDSQALPVAGVKSAAMQSRATLPWQESLCSEKKGGGGKNNSVARLVERFEKATGNRNAVSNGPFKSDAKLQADFPKTLRPWLNRESSPCSPGNFLNKGAGEINRVEGTKRESQKRQALIQTERNKEAGKQKKEAQRVKALRAEIQKNPNLELRAKLKGMRERISRPGFDVGLPLLGDATYSSAFFVTDAAAIEQPKAALDLHKELAVSGSQSPVNLSRSTSQSTQTSMLSEESPLIEEKAPWLFNRSVDSGIEAMGDGEHQASSEQLLTRVRRPSTPTQAKAVVHRSSTPMQAKAVSTPSPAAPATPKTKWVQTRHGNWEKRTADTEKEAKLFEERSKPVLIRF